MPRLRATEVALHRGDAGPRAALWSHDDLVTLFGAETNRSGWTELGSWCSARALYTDVGPAIVAAGRDLVAGLERVDYVHGDATDLTGIERAAAERVLDGPPVGLVVLGLAAFLDDGTLARALDAMYDAAPAGSWLIFEVPVARWRPDPAQEPESRPDPAEEPESRRVGSGVPHRRTRAGRVLGRNSHQSRIHQTRNALTVRF
ncbi:SAM-dependent methyltransferase [Virgisporangium ochraceum]|uniref:Uncharacterized protein n=1 Tax=Virgisporangium ochraceum TaxID=65505 RepID=A0A8J3ZZM7_9ACTN|nr:SAM-dependent methyltransferase [Virgisporangium ochraceum]GIJ71138.1 hypothetical protein Voc01_060550 [Virgisporangium ochraceum]